MSTPQEFCARYELEASAFETLYAVFEEIDRALDTANLRVARELCRKGRSQLTRAVACLED